MEKHAELAHKCAGSTTFGEWWRTKCLELEDACVWVGCLGSIPAHIDHKLTSMEFVHECTWGRFPRERSTFSRCRSQCNKHLLEGDYQLGLRVHFGTGSATAAAYKFWAMPYGDQLLSSVFGTVWRNGTSLKARVWCADITGGGWVLVELFFCSSVYGKVLDFSWLLFSNCGKSTGKQPLTRFSSDHQGRGEEPIARFFLFRVIWACAYVFHFDKFIFCLSVAQMVRLLLCKNSKNSESFASFISVFSL